MQATANLFDPTSSYPLDVRTNREEKANSYSQPRIRHRNETSIRLDQLAEFRRNSKEMKGKLFTAVALWLIIGVARGEPAEVRLDTKAGSLSTWLLRMLKDLRKRPEVARP